MLYENYTPHPIVVLDGEDKVISEIPSLGQAHCDQVDGDPMQVGDFIVKSRRYGNVSGLPDAQPGVILIVSQLVAQAAPQRGDLVWPGDVKRENGQIVGCYNFCRL